MSSSTLDRRQFLTSLGLAAGSCVLRPEVGLAQAAPRAPADVRVGSRPVLQPGDFTYLGAFRVPSHPASGWNTEAGHGLTHRYVNGELRFFSTTSWKTGEMPSQLFEFSDPGVAPTPPYPLATTRRFWGDVYQDRRWLGAGSPGILYSVYWDETDARLYWTYAQEYNGSYGDNPVLGYSRLNEVTGVGTAVGVWGMSGRGEKACRGGVIPIPSAFAAAYTGGRRLGVGFGGYFSVASTGPIHMGPALAAIDPPNIASQENRSLISSTALLGYPFNATPYTSPDRCHRDTDYMDVTPGAWPVRDGVGYWTWGDRLFQSAVWIDLPDKHGVLYCPVLANGTITYPGGTFAFERQSTWWLVYDPADLALVAQGIKRQHEIQPKTTWSVRYPHLTYPLPGYSNGDSQAMVIGADFDPTTRLLYLMMGGVWADDSVFFPAVHVYKVI